MIAGYHKCLAGLAILLLPFCITSCTKDRATYPAITSGGCDTNNISYHQCVQPIFKYYCYSCHSDSASQNGAIAFDIETFASLKTYLNLYYHNDSIYGSKLYHEIEQTPGIISMPPTGKISDNNIGIIKNWLANGGPDN